MKDITITFFLIIFIFTSFLCSSTIKDKTGENDIEFQNMDTIDSTNLKFNFELSYNETSKDSHSETTEIHIFDKKVIVSKKYHGFLAPKNEHFEKKLNDTTEKMLIDFVNINNFNTNYNETKDIKGIGISEYLYIQILSPYKSIITIEGKTNIWGSDDYVRKEWGKKYVETRTNIENIKYFSLAKEFVRLVENL